MSSQPTGLLFAPLMCSIGRNGFAPAYFFNCHIFTIPGRTFPVEILYSKDWTCKIDSHFAAGSGAGLCGSRSHDGPPVWTLSANRSNRPKDPPHRAFGRHFGVPNGSGGDRHSLSGAARAHAEAGSHEPSAAHHPAGADRIHLSELSDLEEYLIQCIYIVFMSYIDLSKNIKLKPNI